MSDIKKSIMAAMARIAKRRPGNSRLIYDKATKTIISVSRDGKKTKCLNVSNEDADMFSR